MAWCLFDPLSSSRWILFVHVLFRTLVGFRFDSFLAIIVVSRWSLPSPPDHGADLLFFFVTFVCSHSSPTLTVHFFRISSLSPFAPYSVISFSLALPLVLCFALALCFLSLSLSLVLSLSLSVCCFSSIFETFYNNARDNIIVIIVSHSNSFTLSFRLLSSFWVALSTFDFFTLNRHDRNRTNLVLLTKNCLLCQTVKLSSRNVGFEETTLVCSQSRTVFQPGNNIETPSRWQTTDDESAEQPQPSFSRQCPADRLHFSRLHR